MTKAYEDAGVIIHKNFQGFKEVKRVDQPPATAVQDGTAHEKRTEGPSPQKQLRILDNEGQIYDFNEVLWAIGRAPEIKELNLDVTGIKLTKKGHIAVDEFQNTNVEGIYALGDVTGQAELTPGK